MRDMASVLRRILLLWPPSMPHQGTFIVLEGTDGSGKETQTKQLVTRLQQEGHNVEEISFPQYGKPSAAMVEAYLNGDFGSAAEVGPYRASILFAADRYAASSTMRDWLDAGKIVVANRFVGSNMAHQGGKIVDTTERKRYIDWNYKLEYSIFGIPKPDINVILHVTPEISQQLVDKKDARQYIRTGGRDIHEDDIDHLRQAEQTYLTIADSYPEFELIHCSPSGVMRSIADIHQEIWQRIAPILSN